MGDNVQEVPVLIAPVPLLACGEVGSVLGRWEPVRPPARVLSCRELAGGLHRDLTRLEEVNQQTAIEVARWFSGLVRRGGSRTSEEIFSVASLEGEGHPPAQGGKQILGGVLGRVRVPRIQEQIVEMVAVLWTPAVDVPVTMQLKFQ